ncbi:MAG: sugar kinase [Acidobacteria bacterium]|nr:sugar kinase [Acidobacteriota bacterium]
MSLVVVGSVAFDALETPFGRVARTLGGAATYFSVAASFFTQVRLVGIVGDDFTARDAAVFNGRSINLEGLERAQGKSFFWAGRYSDDLNHRDTLVTELNVFANFQPKLPPSYRDSQYLFLANIDPTLQRSVLTQMRRRPKLVALDTMNYWIERTPVELRKTLKVIDVLVINDTETKQLAGDKNLLKAAHKVMKMGPKTLVVKRGEYGAVLLTKNSIFSVPGYPLREPHDPTGAGDAFAGGFMGAIAASGRVNDRSLRRAMVYGSVLGSFTVEEMGLDRLRRLTRREIDSRAREFARLTQFHL